MSDKDAVSVEPMEGGGDARYSNLSVLETAAQRGIGPLSDLGRRVWHGESIPCISCGELVARSASQCQLCGQDLSQAMADRMRAHAGPWYVMEHVRPFPGVTLERLIRQAKRGVLVRTTIVRGPTTEHQWRFAAETPGLSRFVGCCWQCQSDVKPQAHTCASCSADLLPAATAGEANLPGDSPGDIAPELAELTAALQRSNAAIASHAPDDSGRIGPIRAGWVIGALVIFLIVAVVYLARIRREAVEGPADDNGSRVGQVIHLPVLSAEWPRQVDDLPYPPRSPSPIAIRSECQRPSWKRHQSPLDSLGGSVDIEIEDTIWRSRGFAIS
ncbi:MAG: hypothetical protein IH988_00550 [Planctomycetes bacterium]|nr:hypothetical protein [Planctomycetota bacterium]